MKHLFFINRLGTWLSLALFLLNGWAWIVFQRSWMGWAALGAAGGITLFVIAFFHLKSAGRWK